MAGQEKGEQNAKKRPNPGGPAGTNKRPKKVATKAKKKKAKPVEPGSVEDVLRIDVRSMMASLTLTEVAGTGSQPPPPEEGGVSESEPPLPEEQSEIEVEVKELSSTGDGLALQDGSRRIYLVPFAFPGDKVRVKVFRHLEDYSVTDFISVIKPSPVRDDARIKCQYFAKCGGCQLQPLTYADQLAFKRRVVEKAFANLSDLPPDLLPVVGETIASPLQYGYRTKLTPHYDRPRPYRGDGPAPPAGPPNIGFMRKGTRQTLDVEDCPIGTDVVRKRMKRERARVHSDFAKSAGKLVQGETILLRESTERYPKDANGVAKGLAEAEWALPEETVKVETEKHVDIKTCITDQKATAYEYVDDYVFTNPAGSFFQNNNSILPTFTSYIREHLLPRPATGGDGGATNSSANPSKQVRHLIDAYSGSGLFTITLSNLVGSIAGGSSIGIDSTGPSIECARRNAKLNNLPESQCHFMAADARELFKNVPKDFDPDETVVVIDPPRKGCSDDFLRQLLKFAPRRIVYVSCNVHTQARDVGVMVRGRCEGQSPRPGSGGSMYAVESLRGFDFFPQTGHVEGVAVLNRVDEPTSW